MNQYFFNWHGLDMKHFTHTRTRIIAAITFLCALLMSYISLLSHVSVDILTASSILLLPLGLFSILKSYRATKAVLLVSILAIELVTIFSTSVMLLLPVFLVLDAILAWFLFKKEEL